MANHRTAYNTTDQALVVDDDGAVVGGREWGPVNPGDERTKTLVESGELILQDRPEGNIENPQARAAFDRTDEVNTRAEKVASLDKDSLLEVAENAGLIEEGDKVGVRELREAVAENTDVKLPSKTTRKREA